MTKAAQTVLFCPADPHNARISTVVVLKKIYPPVTVLDELRHPVPVGGDQLLHHIGGLTAYIKDMRVA